MWPDMPGKKANEYKDDSRSCGRLWVRVPSLSQCFALHKCCFGLAHVLHIDPSKQNLFRGEKIHGTEQEASVTIHLREGRVGQSCPVCQFADIDSGNKNVPHARLGLEISVARDDAEEFNFKVECGECGNGSGNCLGT